MIELLSSQVCHMDSDILQAHMRRLKLLQVRAAEMGRDTPPHILTEIEDIQQLLKKSAWLVDWTIGQSISHEKKKAACTDASSALLQVSLQANIKKSHVSHLWQILNRW